MDRALAALLSAGWLRVEPVLTQAPSRWGRAGLFALVAVALSLGAHLAGGGTPPGPFTVLAGGVLVAGVCGGLAGRQLGRSAIVLLLSAAQLGLHTAYARVADAHAMPSHLHSSMAPGSLPHAEPLAHQGWTMLAAHAVATVLLALLLAHGEAILWALATAFGGRVPAAAPLVAVGRVAGAHEPGAIAPRLSLRSPVRRRGPPRLATAG